MYNSTIFIIFIKLKKKIQNNLKNFVGMNKNF